jgi:hypothetical protein
MRFLIVSLLISLPAFACPNLTGTYSACRNQSGEVETQDLSITQQTVSGVTYFTTASTDVESGERSTEIIAADGQPRTTSETDPDSGMTIDTTTTATCQGDKLVLDIEISMESMPLGQIQSVIQKQGSALMLTTQGEVFGEPVNSVSTCL